VIVLTKTLARESGQFKINVNAVAFGLIETRMTVPKTEDSLIDLDGRSIKVGIPEPTLAALASTIPLGRAGRPHEAAGGVAFLCSPWSDYVSGQVLNIARGLPAGMSG
jgi:3-oxoacyl-[acyl-carrier protein] reductase